jgi:hypothetical protein
LLRRILNPKTANAQKLYSSRDIAWFRVKVSRSSTPDVSARDPPFGDPTLR